MCGRAHTRGREVVTFFLIAFINEEYICFKLLGKEGEILIVKEENYPEIEQLINRIIPGRFKP